MLVLTREGGVGNGRGGDEGLDDDGRSVRVDFGAVLEPFTIRIRERQTDTVNMGHDQLLTLAPIVHSRPLYLTRRSIGYVCDKCIHVYELRCSISRRSKVGQR